MYPGRSSWTRGLLALGVGALFLLGCRTYAAGDASSASTAIGSDRDHFSVAAASPRSVGRRDDRGEKEEQRPSNGDGWLDRQPSRGDYSASGEPRGVHRNAEPDGEHGASRSTEDPLPPRRVRSRNDETRGWIAPGDVEGNDGESQVTGLGSLENVEGNDRRSIDESLPSWNLEETDVAEDGNDRESKSSYASLTVEQREHSNERKSLNSSMKISTPPWKLAETERSKGRKVERSRSPGNLEGNDRGSINYSAESSQAPRDLEKKEYAKSYEVVRSRRTENFEEASYSAGSATATRNLGEEGRGKSYVSADSDSSENFKGANRGPTSYSPEILYAVSNPKSYSIEEPISAGDPKEKDEKSTSYLSGDSIARNRRKHFEENDRDSTSYSVTSSFPLRNVERNGGSKSYAVDESLPSRNPERNDEVKGEHDGGSASYSVRQSFPLSSSENDDRTVYKSNDDSNFDRNTKEYVNDPRSNYHSMQNLENPAENEGRRLFSSNNLDKDDSTPRKSRRSINSKKGDRKANDYNSTSASKKSSLPSSDLEQSNSIENNRESTLDAIERKEKSYARKNTLPASNLEKIDATKNERGSKQKSSMKKNDFASLEDPRGPVDEGRDRPTAFRSDEAGTKPGEKDESRFSKDDEELNGSPAGERSDVKENLSREVNGRSMNEVGKSLERSYYNDVGSSLSLTLREGLGENDGETETFASRRQDSPSLESAVNHETIKQNDPPDNRVSGKEKPTFPNTNNRYRKKRKNKEYPSGNSLTSSTSVLESERYPRSLEDQEGYKRPKRESSRSKSRRDERSVSIGRRVGRDGSDFHNSARLFDSAAGEEGYESIDPPGGGTRRLAGMYTGPGRFFRQGHGSRKDRAAERDRGNILEEGTRETRSRDRSPGATDPSSVFRGIDATDGYHAGTRDSHEITDRAGWGVANADKLRSVSSRLRGTAELFDGEITRATRVTDKTVHAVQGFEDEGTLERFKLGDDSGVLMVRGNDAKSEVEGEAFKELTLNDDGNEFDSGFPSIKEFEVAERGERSASLIPRTAEFHREKTRGIRRKRYTNYYSPQSVSPMAYVHIQPAYPVPPPPAPNRKCVQCMVVYKPCSSAPRLPPKTVLPTYKYQDLASKWQGLKYGCRCNPIGSMATACDIVTGQCQCKPHVIGRQCDQCMVGFWDLTTGTGCAPCECDPIGAYNSSCHQTLGHCYCKPGVSGMRCDSCLPGYYGFSPNGCQVCDPCLRPGHICDPQTGRCVCPTLTFGEHCDRCRPGSWDLVPGVGCRPCACTLGSTRPQCDHQGQCPCRIGYDGLRCERCAKGYYGYPRCRPCNCNVAGTLQCNNEICDCNEQGQCPCKEHVIGRQCNECKEGTFGLAVDNPKGCTECFCFGRTTSCQQAGLSWGQRRLTRPRTLYVNDTSNDIVVTKFRSQIFLSPINGGLNVTNGLSTIPDTEGDVTIPPNLYYNYPLYWMLPEYFLGDKVVSYGGFLRFTTLTEGGIPLRSTFQYPIVQLQGNNKIVLEYYLPAPANDNHYEVRFHESLWQLQNRPDYKVTREVLMVALQNLQHILVKASDNAEFTKTTLLEASLDAAVLTPMHTPSLAISVEICKCPPQYNSTSCQNPSIGYFRWYKNTTVTSTIVIDLVGEARRCQCNRRSDVCDTETGYCLNCRGNTAGSRCDVCADSFYGHPEFGCKPCPCPQADKRFSSTCVVLANAEPICVCKPGYTGRKCERCSPGYYGFPHLPNGKCTPCNCNPAGSLSDECNTETGQCRCRAGSTGRDCSQCTAYRHVYINNVCTSCDDNCTGILLDTVAELSHNLAGGTSHIANGYVPPPWKELSYIDSNVTAFLKELDLQNKLKKRVKSIPWHEYKKLMTQVETLFRTANEYAKEADTLQSKSNDLKNNVFSANIELENLRKDIDDTITLLNQYSNENKRIEIKKALKIATMILNNLKSANLPAKRMEIERFLENVAEYTDLLNSLYDPTEPLAIAQDEVEDYSEKLNDMRNIIEDTMETLFTYDGLYNEINRTYLEGKNYCNEINMLRGAVDAPITEAVKLTNETRGFIVDFQDNMQDIQELQDKLTHLYDKLSMKEELLERLNYEYNDTYVIPAVAHVKNLSNYVDKYVSLFSETRNIAASPLKASQAYKNIVDRINSANITATEANEIAEETFEKVFPNGPTLKSLLDTAKEMLLASTRQRDSAKKHLKMVQKVGEKSELQKEAVNTLKNTLNSTGIRDNEINVKLEKLQGDSEKLRGKIETVLRDNEKVLESIKTSQMLIEDYKEAIMNRLKPKLNKLKRESDSKISLASENLTEALSNTKKTDAKLTSLANAAVRRKNEFDKWNSTLATKLQSLKDKIVEARNTADGIRLSMRSADGKECSRSYRPSTLQPTSTNTIVMTFALPKGKKEGPLFYLPSSINDDFIALEIVDRKVRFVWNVGGGTGIVTHPEVIQSGNIRNDSMWYRIKAERVRHIGKLSVSKQATITEKSHSVMDSTNAEYGRFDITTTDRAWIGKIPRSERRRTELLASNGLPGCVHQVILDGKPIGLWNFITTAPDMACEACVEGVEDARDDTYSFNGEGYAVRNRVSSGPYYKYSFSVSMNFRTYDENALLLLAINPKNDQHIMLSLREGKVILYIRYGGNVSIKLSTNFKYNTGNWIKLDASRHYDTRKKIEQCSLNVGGKNDQRIVAPSLQPKTDDIPDFNQAKYYIGGVPPSFRTDKVMLPPQVSFLGCMSNINIGEGYDPMAEQYYGVEPTCRNETLRIVGFYGDGYLQYSAYTLRKSTLSFSFRTMQEKAVLLLSTFEGQEEHMPNIRHMNDESNKKSYYSICIINGQVQVRLNSGRGELVLQSNDTFNDGRYHSVTVIKKRKDVELRIDDAYQSAGKLPTGAAIKAPEGNGGLFFGGLPVLINNTNMIATTTPLYGAIKDAIFNDEIIQFNKAISFEHALIGRPGPSMGKDPPAYTPSASLSRGMSTQPEGCQKVPYYSLEAGALKFGDKPNSHTQHYLDFKKFWEKKYSIEFDFRTYYPNGLLFITPGIRTKHYLMVVIRDGQLLLLVKSKQKKEILFKTPFNDGNWHHVMISHNERKLTLLVDTQTPRTIKVPRKIGLASMMYIGGLPESGTLIPEQVVVKLETLKGCIRGLRINGNVYDMVGSTSKAFQVGQCFPNVESGAYFQDEAYATYKRNFELGAVLELQLEFRTSELSGVLLSITAPGNSPSLSLELNNGKVIMSVDLGDNNPLDVEQYFTNPYTICDNRWHRIQAVYNDEELALKVDEMDQKYGLPANVNYHMMDSTVSGPLYIGGLPASAPKGTLRTRDHFNGCIRNVMIGGERRDWTDMDELHNIHLSSCPVQ